MWTEPEVTELLPRVCSSSPPRCNVPVKTAAARSLRLGVTFWLGLVLAVPISAQGQQTPTETLVQIRVDTQYDDSPRSLKVISALIDRLPPIQVEYRKGETPSEFIFREYRVSTYTKDSLTYLPKSYALLEKAILSMNGAKKPEELRAGPIRIPDVPPKALEHFNTSKALNFLPKIWAFQAQLRVSLSKSPKQGKDMLFVSRPVALASGRPAAQRQLLEIPVVATVADNILNDPVLSSIGAVFNYPMSVKLAENATAQPPVASPDHLVLTDSERQFIQTILATRAQRDVYMFVLDTGWPDAGTYDESWKSMNDLMTNIWKHYFTMEFPPPPPSQPFVAPSVPHSAFILRSLNEFRQLDPNNHIRIIYVPLTREQDATPFLEALLETNYLLERLPNGKPLKPTQDIVKQARKDASDVIRHAIPNRWTGDQVQTDKSILDAVLGLGNAYAEEADSAFFVSESWTVQHKEYHVIFPSPLEGLVVSAVGNSNENVNKDEIDFSQRCLSDRDTIAVMNLRRPVQPTDVGLLCCSSTIDESHMDDALAVGYDGEITGTGCADICGTSFAAPRVAWLLAADEAVRRQPLQPGLWQASEQERLKAARDQSAAGFNKLWFDPIKFLEQSQK
jgi:hypothetical protein